MTREIAVYVDQDGQAASLYEPGMIVVYQRKQGQWSAARKKEFALNQSTNLQEMRLKMGEAVDFLGDCKVLAGLSIVGVPYFELEKNNFSIWEFEGWPLEFLDYVLAKEEEKTRDVAEAPEFNYAPVEVTRGHYRVSIKEIQENNIGVTSKQVLLPFLRKGQFISLEVSGNHMPVWLETELLTGLWSMEVLSSTYKEFRVVIRKNT